MTLRSGSAAPPVRPPASTQGCCSVLLGSIFPQNLHDLIIAVMKGGSGGYRRREQADVCPPWATPVFTVQQHDAAVKLNPNFFCPGSSSLTQHSCRLQSDSARVPPCAHAGGRSTRNDRGPAFNQQHHHLDSQRDHQL